MMSQKRALLFQSVRLNMPLRASPKGKVPTVADARPQPKKKRFENIVVERDGGKIDRWEHATKPSYFEAVEMDAQIAEGRSDSAFARFATEASTVRPVREIKKRYAMVRGQAAKAVRRRTQSSCDWPVGEEESLDPTVLGQVSFAADSARLIGIEDMLKAFELDCDAERRVLNGETSLLAEASRACRWWARRRSGLEFPETVPERFVGITRVIDPDEPYYECKRGVFLMPKRKSVIKFLKTKSSYPDFVWEAALGLTVRRIKGVVPVRAVCAEAFCVEMDFAGIGLDYVLNGDVGGVLPNGARQQDAPPVSQSSKGARTSIGCLYSVRMMQACGWMDDSAPVADTYHATLAAGELREDILANLPFFLAEMANVVTRLAQQGIVNPDIKCDNFVVDPATGQPLMIDLGLTMPEGARDSSRGGAKPADHPQSPPEFLGGKICHASAMVFGLAYTFRELLATLVSRTGDQGAVAAYTNLHFSNWLRGAYAAVPHDRPSAASGAKIIGSVFPLSVPVAALFERPQHLVYAR